MTTDQLHCSRPRRQRRCQKHLKAYKHAWYLRNKDRLQPIYAKRHETNRGYKKAYDRARYLVMRDKILERGRQYYWRTVGERRKASGLYARTHREQRRVYALGWKLKNREKVKAASQRYYNSHYRGNKIRIAVANHKRLQRLRNAPGVAFTAEDMQNLLLRQNGQCYWCQAALSSKYEVDHVWPLVLGGSNGVENICLACRHCNRVKSDKIDFAMSLP